MQATTRSEPFRFGVLGLLALALGGCFGAPAFVGPPSDHFDGEAFFNVPPTSDPSFWDLLAWKAQSRPTPWPDAATAPAKVVPRARVEQGIVATQIGHATVLVQLDGLAFVTDPVWSDTIGPVAGVGPGRYDPPAVALEELPRLDGVLLSHSHYDHCDAPTLRALRERFGMPIFGGLGTRSMLEDLGISGGVDLDWWGSSAVGSSATVHFVPVRHWSRRGLADHNVVLWGGFVVAGRSGSVYFAGDTAYGPHFAETRRRLGEPDLALLPIGAYLPRWFMGSMHMGPDEAVRAHLELGAGRSLGMHWGTFRLADEGRFQAAGELGLALDAARVSRAAFVAARPGEVVEVPGRARR